MSIGSDQLNPISLNFKDSAFENGFLNHIKINQAEYLQIGYGFLVLFFMAVAVVQLLFVTAPLYSNLVYAGLGLIALAGFSLLRPERNITVKQIFGFSGAIVVGAGMAIYLPASMAALQVTAAIISLVWLASFSSLMFKQVGALIGLIFLPLMSLTAFVLWPLSASQLAVFSSIVLTSFFVLLSSYAIERRLRSEFYQQYVAGEAKSPQVARHFRVNANHGLQVLKELTAELSAVPESDRFYVHLLKYIKKVTTHDMVAIGRVKNGRMIPVLMRSHNDDDISVEDTVKLLWHSNLIQQLKKHKAPLISQAEMGLLPSVLMEDGITFGYRLDIPFFAHGRLDGVVTLLRSQPSFNEAEAAVVASVVFHGLFAFGVARLQRQHQFKPGDTMMSAAMSSAKAKPHKILPVEEFLEQANTIFHQAKQDDKPVSLLLIEVDQYSKLVKRYGKGIDKGIVTFLSRLLGEYAVPDSMLGRYGSGSFALQVPLTVNEAKKVADKLCALIRKKTLRLGNKQVSLTVSIGVATRDRKVPDFLSLVRGADIGLYLAREDQGSSVRVNH